MKGIFVDVTDAMQVYGVSQRQAIKKLNHIKLALNKPPGTRILVREFCKYEDIHEQDFLQAIKPHKPTTTTV